MKIKIPKKFYTAEQLAERWECTVEDVQHLIEVGDLATRERLAAKNGKDLAEVFLIDGLEDIDREYDRLREMLPEGYDEKEYFNQYHWSFCDKSRINNVGKYKGMTDFQILEAEGAFDRVITAAEVERFETKYGEPEDPPAPARPGPKTGPRDATLHKVIAGLALANGYKRDSKNDQDWMAGIIRKTGLDRKTIKAAIDASLDELGIQ